jgi:hypothetical protein
VVLDESDECLYWLAHLFDTSAATGPEAEALWKEANELTKIFAKSYETANGKERAANRVNSHPRSDVDSAQMVR